MNILYLHGLESRLSDVKRDVLLPFGNVFAPDLDYKNNAEIFDWILDFYKNQSSET